MGKGVRRGVATCPHLAVERLGRFGSRVRVTLTLTLPLTLTRFATLESVITEEVTLVDGGMGQP